jgi:sugar phosphate permease
MNPQARNVDQDALQSAVRRAGRRLIPFLLLMYVMSYLDRANIGYAKQAYQAATGVSDAAFALGAGIFFLTYALFEVPSNLALHWLGARVWMARIMVTWGLVAASMIFAHSATAFLTIRLLLGAAEAGFFPGSILYLTYWFPANSRGKVMAWFYFGAPLAMMLGGPTSGVLLDLDGTWGLQGWQLMFLVEGLLTTAVGVWAYFYLADRPASAQWLPSAERDALLQALTEEEQTKPAHGGMGTVFREPKLLHFTAIYALVQLSGYGVAFYLPTQVSALLGIKMGALVGLVSAIPWACAILAGWFWPAFAVRTGYRRTCGVISLLGIGIGLALSAHLPPKFAIAALCLVTAGIITAQPIFWTFPTAYFGGIGAAAGIAAINALGNLGGFIAPTAKTWFEESWGSADAGLYFLAGSSVLAALLFAALPAVVEQDLTGARDVVR